MSSAILERERGTALFAGERAVTHPVPGPASYARSARSRWHPRVRLVMLLVIVLPTLSVALLAGSDASSRRTFGQGAAVVSQDLARLQLASQAREQLDNSLFPLMALSDASHLATMSSGHYPDINASTLSTFAGTNVVAFLQNHLPLIESNPTFASTPALRSDSSALHAIVPEVEFDAATFTQVTSVAFKFVLDVDRAWYADYNQLERDIETWKPEGSFQNRVAALHLIYAAFITGTSEFEGTMYVLVGQPNTPVLYSQGGATGMQAAEEVTASHGEFVIMTGDADGLTPSEVLQVGPATAAALHIFRTNAQDGAFDGFEQQAVAAALNGTQTAAFTSVSTAGSAVADGLHYVGDLSSLLQAAVMDLTSMVTAQESAATSHFRDDLVFLLMLGFVSLSGALIAGNVITRPLRRLAAAAQTLSNGDFGVPRLPEAGPRELATTTSAFNDMASTLRAVESTTVALANEDLSQPELLVPLPGRTGQALQAVVSALTARIRERELQRKLLHEEATHDRLTGLLNRAAVFDYLNDNVSRRRAGGELVAVLFVDLNGLKAINDTYGHEAGDAAIKTTGDALRRATGDCDVVGRLGGDEFLVVLCTEHSRDAATTSDRMRAEVAGCSIMAKDLLVGLEASVGVALAQCGAETDPKDLVSQADQAMYEAKKLGHAARDRLASTAAPASSARDTTATAGSAHSPATTPT